MNVESKKNGELMESMAKYTKSNKVDEILKVLYKKVLEEQPLDPLEYLVRVLNEDAEIAAIENQTVEAWHANIEEYLVKVNVNGETIDKSNFLSQIKTEDGAKHLQQCFPDQHAKLGRWLEQNVAEAGNEMPRTALIDSFMEALKGRWCSC